MPYLFYNLSKNILKIFSGKNLIWHGLAIALTYFIVVSGFDWTYHIYFQQFPGYKFFFLGAGLLGFVLPVFVPLTILLAGKFQKNVKTVKTAWTMGQAGILGLLISWFYKAFTGRPGPEVIQVAGADDISKIFRFGFLRGGVFWGWPSSHTMVAFAVAVTLIILYPKSNFIKTLAAILALYIGFGASISFHWVSDCIAGAIIGIVIGLVVAKAFSKAALN